MAPRTISCVIKGLVPSTFPTTLEPSRRLLLTAGQRDWAAAEVVVAEQACRQREKALRSTGVTPRARTATLEVNWLCAELTGLKGGIALAFSLKRSPRNQ